MSAGEEKSGKDGLPQLDSGKIYFLRKSAIDKIERLIDTYRPRVVTGGGLQIDSQSEEGTFLSTDGS